MHDHSDRRYTNKHFVGNGRVPLRLFGDEYVVYANETKRLIPGIY